ncbi:6094_t:CDS:1, partial [Cetraspora pellucida]
MKFNKLELSYLICQYERCIKTNRLHIQSYCQTENHVSYQKLKQIFNNSKLHIEYIFGLFEAASNYCKSEFFQKKGTYKTLDEKFQLIPKISKRIEGHKNIVGLFEF